MYSDRLNILILYDQYVTHIKTIWEYLVSFSKFSRHNIFYAPATRDKKIEFDLDVFDVVIIHYSIRLSNKWHLSQSFAQAITRYAGLKVLFIQDEYENTEQARLWIEELDIDLVFSCIPQDQIANVYPPERFPGTGFTTVLTGYVPDFAPGIPKLVPLEDRKRLIGYRARELPVWYGSLAQEKSLIGKKMKEVCIKRGLTADIEWEPEKRIFGDDWYHFLATSKVTLGAESGSNVFDEIGEIKRDVLRAQRKNPTLTYEELYDEYVAPHEGVVKMNQISPRVFEAIALRTGLVMFKGQYSGIVYPDRHYIPLEKDFSNIEEVLDKIRDSQYLRTIIDRAYADIVESGRFSYQAFVGGIDEKFEGQVLSTKESLPVVGIIGRHQGQIPQNFNYKRRSLDGIALSIPLQYFRSWKESGLENSLKKSFIGPLFELFKHNRTFSQLVRFLYSLQPIRKLINYLLR